MAGLLATAAMTLSPTIEMESRGREPSSTTADAAAKVLGVQPRDADGAQSGGSGMLRDWHR